MRFCEKCGKEIIEGAKFCNSCGAAVEDVVLDNSKEVKTNEAPVEKVEQVVEEKETTVPVEEVAQETEAEGVAASVEATANSVVNNVKKKSNIKMTKKLWIIIAAITIVVIIAVVAILNTVKMNEYKSILEEAYSSMSYGAEQAESYASLESKVWRNCIYKEASTETDEYTKNDYGLYYSDFNDALKEFYSGEYLTYSLVSSNISTVNNYMAKLRDCPDKFEEEYRAIKEMYVAYSDLTDLVVGSSSYSWNSFNEALESAKANYKSALSSARLLLE